jgi:hypothetical protein
MKLAVAGNLEEDHVAVVRERTVYDEASDGPFKRLNICRP